VADAADLALEGVELKIGIRRRVTYRRRLRAEPRKHHVEVGEGEPLAIVIYAGE
jgi:hypothetical protein